MLYSEHRVHMCTDREYEQTHLNSVANMGAFDMELVGISMAVLFSPQSRSVSVSGRLEEEALARKVGEGTWMGWVHALSSGITPGSAFLLAWQHEIHSAYC